MCRASQVAPPSSCPEPSSGYRGWKQRVVKWQCGCVEDQAPPRKSNHDPCLPRECEAEQEEEEELDPPMLAPGEVSRTIGERRTLFARTIVHSNDCSSERLFVSGAGERLFGRTIVRPNDCSPRTMANDSGMRTIAERTIVRANDCSPRTIVHPNDCSPRTIVRNWESERLFGSNNCSFVNRSDPQIVRICSSPIVRRWQSFDPSNRPDSQFQTIVRGEQSFG